MRRGQWQFRWWSRPVRISHRGYHTVLRLSIHRSISLAGLWAAWGQGVSPPHLCSMTSIPSPKSICYSSTPLHFYYLSRSCLGDYSRLLSVFPHPPLAPLYSRVMFCVQITSLYSSISIPRWRLFAIRIKSKLLWSKHKDLCGQSPAHHSKTAFYHLSLARFAPIHSLSWYYSKHTKFIRTSGLWACYSFCLGRASSYEGCFSLFMS